MITLKCNAKIVSTNQDFTIAVIETIATDSKMKQYFTNHNLQIPHQDILLPIGTYIQLAGNIIYDDNFVMIEPLVLKLLDHKPNNLNMYAWVEGQAVRDFPGTNIRSTSIYKAIVTDRFGQFTTGLVFGSLIKKFKDTFKKGVFVKLAGRIQYNIYRDITNRECEVASIVCSPEWSMVIDPVKKIDPYSFGGDDLIQKDLF